ncbi:microtubule-associated protein 6 [Pituophis catenifer annectens]|uniref:microtubule-associated protein 6 n=1 Tax=Pituophis catenifer annectens TaxID=94852 RepID=UPI003996236F
MAWPCISRACCIARFWNQLDKADIAVPLVFTKYSEATELPATQVVFQQQQQQPARPLPSAIDIQPAGLSSDYHAHARPASAVDHGPAAPPGPSSRAPKETPMADSVMREDFKAWKVQGPEPSCKPKNEFQPSDQPFANQSQYQKDFRPWPIPKRGDHPWIPKQMAIPAVELDKGTKEPRSSSWERRSKSQIGYDRSEQKKEEAVAAKPAPEERATKTKKKAQQPEDQARPPHQQPGPSGTQEGGKGRAVVDALNRQIKEEVTARVSTSCYRNEFRPWTDIRPVRAIKAKSQYEPPDEKMFHQTSYSSQFTAEGAKPGPPDNKYMERRRIRTLYKEPLQESPKVEKPSPQPSKPKKTTPSHKSVKKPKDKQMASSRASKKKSAETPSRTATAEDKEKRSPIKPSMIQLRNPNTLQQECPMEAQT